MARTERNNIFFEDLFKTNFHQLYVHAYSWVNDEECAKDIVHDSFCYLWEHFEHYADQANLLPLLYTIVKSRSIDYIRQSQAKERYLQEQKQEEAITTDDYEDYDDRVSKAIQAIKKLPSQTRRVFIECVLHHKTYKETGELLGISPLTVKTLMSRALKSIRAQSEFFSPIIILFCTLSSFL